MPDLQFKAVPLAPSLGSPLPQATAYQPGTTRQTIGTIVGALVSPISPVLGSVLRNAVGGRSATLAGVGGDPALQAMQAQMAASSRSLLMFQYQINTEQQVYQAISASIKARHDSAMFAIQNIR